MLGLVKPPPLILQIFSQMMNVLTQRGFYLIAPLRATIDPKLF